MYNKIKYIHRKCYENRLYSVSLITADILVQREEAVYYLNT